MTKVQGNGFSGRFGPSAVSADGRTASFDSEATNLVPGDTNVAFDVFVRDRTTGITERVSVSSTGTTIVSRLRASYRTGFGI